MFENKEYAMLYKREIISEDFYIFLPCHIIYGEYDASDKSITDITGNPFYESSNPYIITSMVDLTYYYNISDVDLLNMYQTDDIDDAIGMYYEGLKSNILIGKLNSKDNAISIQEIPYRYLDELLERYNIKVEENLGKISITKAQLMNIIYQNDIFIMKKELSKLIDTASFMERVYEKSGVSEATASIGSKNIIVDSKECIDAYNTPIETGEVRETIDKNYLSRCREIYDYITKYLIGQDDSIKTLVSVMLNNMDAINQKEVIKPLIIGQTGSGKTYFFKLLSKYLDIPVIIVDCNLLVQSGYKGQSIEDMLKELYILCGKDKEKAQRAIVFLDEIDKLAGRGADVSDVGVQKALLKFIEGHRYVIELDRLGSEKVAIDTSMMNIAAGGAFENLICKKEKSLGFATTNNELTDTKITSDQLVKYGMIRELIGRFGVFVQYNDVTKEMIKKQLKESYDSPMIINQEKFKRLYGINLNFSCEFIDKIIDEALKNNTGFRGTEQKVNESLINLVFKIQDEKFTENEITITDENLNNEHVKTKKIGL